MRKNLIAVLIGLVTSVTGGYLYSYLIRINFPFVYAVGAICMVIALCGALYLYRGKLHLLFGSEIIGYYPKGQEQYINRAVSEIAGSREVQIVGARGMNLMGENSPVGKALRIAKKLSKVEAFLLEPGGEHSRLRSDHLDVERKKYEAECVSVDNFVGILKIHDGIPITKYSYTKKPRFRLIVTDSSIFLSFYQAGIRGRDLPCWHISKKSKILFPQILIFVEFLRNHSKVTEYFGKKS